jgi:hypothetical protein
MHILSAAVTGAPRFDSYGCVRHDQGDQKKIWASAWALDGASAPHVQIRSDDGASSRAVATATARTQEWSRAVDSDPTRAVSGSADENETLVRPQDPKGESTRPREVHKTRAHQAKPYVSKAGRRGAFPGTSPRAGLESRGASDLTGRLVSQPASQTLSTAHCHRSPTVLPSVLPTPRLVPSLPLYLSRPEPWAAVARRCCCW